MSYKDSSKRIYVGNIPWNVDSEKLQTFFTHIGNLIECRVMYDSATGRSKGFAFLTYTKDEDAKTAISTMNGKNVAGRLIKVNSASQYVSNNKAGGSSEEGGEGDEKGTEWISVQKKGSSGRGQRQMNSSAGGNDSSAYSASHSHAAATSAPLDDAPKVSTGTPTVSLATIDKVHRDSLSSGALSQITEDLVEIVGDPQGRGSRQSSTLSRGSVGASNPSYTVIGGGSENLRSLVENEGGGTFFEKSSYSRSRATSAPLPPHPSVWSQTAPRLSFNGSSSSRVDEDVHLSLQGLSLDPIPFSRPSHSNISPALPSPPSLFSHDASFPRRRVTSSDNFLSDAPHAPNSDEGPLYPPSLPHPLYQPRYNQQQGLQNYQQHPFPPREQQHPTSSYSHHHPTRHWVGGGQESSSVPVFNNADQHQHVNTNFPTQPNNLLSGGPAAGGFVLRSSGAVPHFPPMSHPSYPLYNNGFPSQPSSNYQHPPPMGLKMHTFPSQEQQQHRFFQQQHAYFGEPGFPTPPSSSVFSQQER